jgi:hypothetical protein
MDEQVLIGRGNQMLAVPQAQWEKHLEAIPEHGPKRLAFMTPDYHRVRYFAVRELVAQGRPLEPEYIAGTLGLALERTVEILAELERNLFFLVRDDQGAVAWAYPVTAEKTPHHLTFDSGERIHAA